MLHTRVFRRMEFHIARRARDLYEFDEALYSLNGNVVFANFHGARVFAHRMNQKREAAGFADRAVTAGQINALGLIDEILHCVVAMYREQRSPEAMRQALEWLDDRLGGEAVDRVLRRFADEFPALAVYRREIDVDEYLRVQTDAVPNREIVLEELVLLWLANVNPACAAFNDLFDDEALERETPYAALTSTLSGFFLTQPAFGPDSEPLVAMLRRPAIEVPHSLYGQLEYMLKNWGYLLGSRFLQRLLGSLDLIKEEEKPISTGGPGRASIYEFTGLDAERARYSTDRDWMPRLVLIAKNAYVWLSQLSKQHGRHLGRLDEVPDEELDTLARRGISGLWLIGLWERSAASQRIKQMMGNPEAVASAYSLYDYAIAADLGGEQALHGLRERAWQRGIRLASDMVPNHTGIDSRWVMEHPDWFVQVDASPFPSYTFNGPDLSRDSRAAIALEDHYYSKSDAAVVFKHVDRGNGRERYVYHGNDGTSMPWNDTAQLNYLLPEVREAVIQTILYVARQFPVIRFDAAMTLAKKHYQRLWFPEPGAGGDIASRAEHGLTREQLDALMPQEFWREVVDRAASEAPDTLLLAEAFWMMEGYFVRSLGMHRVYNSAFMNMLRDEMNAEYRQIIKNTLEFDPQILKRYVNFMNNPDERTALDQFGKGDKYFGVCLLLSTLPGLPMFGHGQVEGFGEKYGMEYRRAYQDEQPDAELLARHEHEIFPLLHRRHLFAEAENFRLYDFFTQDGHVVEDVFAYSNGQGDERALVLYHNAYAEARGWVRQAAARSGPGGTGQNSLGESLALSSDDDRFCIYREHISGLEFIRASREILTQGLYLELGAYGRCVFLDFRQVRDDERRSYAQLAAQLNGRGVPSIDAALREQLLEPVRAPFRQLVNASLLQRLLDARVTTAAGEVDAELLDEVEQRLLDVLRGILAVLGEDGDHAAVARQVRQELTALLRLPSLDAPAVSEYLLANLDDDTAAWGTLLGWVFTHALGRLTGERGFEERSRDWLDEWMLGATIEAALQDLGVEGGRAWRQAEWVKALVAHQGWYEKQERAKDGTAEGRPARILDTWMKDEEIRRLLDVNRHEGVLWFSHEAFEQLLWLMLATEAVQIGADEAGRPDQSSEERLIERYEVLRALQAGEAASGYRLEDLRAAVGVGVDGGGGGWYADASRPADSDRPSTGSSVLDPAKGN